MTLKQPASFTAVRKSVSAQQNTAAAAGRLIRPYVTAVGSANAVTTAYAAESSSETDMTLSGVGVRFARETKPRSSPSRMIMPSKHRNCRSMRI